MNKFNSEFWDSIEPGYYDKNFSFDKTSNSIQQIWHYLTYMKQEKFLDSKKVHLDYACGPGTQIGMFSNSKSIGYDPSKPQIIYANQKYKNKNKYFSNNFEDVLSFGKFDVITINGLIEYLSKEEIIELVSNLKNLSKSKCKLILTTPNYSILFRIVEYLSKFFGIINYEEVNKNKFTKKSLTSLLNELDIKRYSVYKIINVGVIIAFLNSKFAIKTEKLIEILFLNKVGFILTAEIDI